MRARARFRLGILMLLPGVLLYTVFLVWPSIQALGTSFTLWSGFSPHKVFVGLENYALVLRDFIFWGGLKNNFLLIAVPGFITLALALYFASVISHGVKGGGLFRVVFFFPNVISFVVIAILWSFIYHPDWGILNSILRVVGLGDLARPWLATNTLIPAIFAPMVWCAVGFFMVLYLAAIQQIPEELFDAAKVDGAGGWYIFRHITWPLVMPINRIAVVFLVLAGLKAFDFIWVFSYGEPAIRNQTMATWIYTKAFQMNDMGYGTALAVVLFLLMLIVSLISLRIMKGGDSE